MKYALNLDENGRILSATFEQFAPIDAIVVEALPDGNISDYLYVGGEYVYEPISVEEQKVEPDAQDDTDAMLVDHEYRMTLLELGITESEV